MKGKINRIKVIFNIAVTIYTASRGIKETILAEMSFKEVIVWTENLMEMYNDKELLNLCIRNGIIELGEAIV